MRAAKINRSVLLLGMAVAVSSFASAERLPVKTYTTADGLGHNNVNRIVRDSRGFLWFCTFEGLSRFDGYSFTTYGVDHGLPSPVINDLLETREGQYWVATGAGLCRFNPKGRPWSVVRSPSSSNQNNRLQPSGSGQPTTDDTMGDALYEQGRHDQSLLQLAVDRERRDYAPVRI
jgi:ligand-binding sensor domain-containing protein